MSEADNNTENNNHNHSSKNPLLIAIVLLVTVTAAFFIGYLAAPHIQVTATQTTETAQISLANQTSAIKSRVFEAYLLEDAFCRGQPEMKDVFAYSDAQTTYNGTKIHTEISCHTQDNRSKTYTMDFDQQSQTITGQSASFQQDGPTKPVAMESSTNMLLPPPCNLNGKIVEGPC